jgi:hypothetical protein
MVTWTRQDGHKERDHADGLAEDQGASIACDHQNHETLFTRSLFAKERHYRKNDDDASQSKKTYFGPELIALFKRWDQLKTQVSQRLTRYVQVVDKIGCNAMNILVRSDISMKQVRP